MFFSNIVCTATRNFITSGKSHAHVLGMVIWRPSQQRRVVLRRRNTVVGGKCTLPSAILVVVTLCVQLTRDFLAIAEFLADIWRSHTLQCSCPFIGTHTTQRCGYYSDKTRVRH